MQTAIIPQLPDISWRTAALAGAAALTAANTAALTLTLRLASSLGPFRHRGPRPRVLPALAIGATAVGALAVGALSVGALAIGTLAIGRLRGGDWALDSLRIRSLQVGQPHGPSLASS
jgi:hypothetical protein